jgi:hypothetical protein
MAAVSLGGLVSGTALGADASPPGGVWQKAIETPGTAALNAGPFASLFSISCPSAGDCVAGGAYTNRAGHSQAFVVSEHDDRWGKAIQIHADGSTGVVNSVSCPSAGACVAVGSYTDRTGHDQAFLVSERGGRWGKAIEVPGTAALDAGGIAAANSVSCPSAGNCGAGGYYADRSRRGQAFVVSERGGRWGKAIEVPGTAALNVIGNAEVNSLSCASAGNCGAGGSYRQDGEGHLQAFVVSERNGRWGKAIEVPGTAALNAGSDAAVNSVSCPSAGNCGAGGTYADRAGALQAFLVSERNGRWGRAIEVPGTATLNVGGTAQVMSVSCPSAGTCSAGGFYADEDGLFQAFVVGERDGRWGTAIEVPGTATLNAGGDELVSSISCPAAGNCGAGGFYEDHALHVQAFVVSERNGRWGKAIEVPGTAALNAAGSAQVTSVSCPSAGECAAAGSYRARSMRFETFVVTQT